MVNGIFELLKKSTTGIDAGYKGKRGPDSGEIQLDLFPD
jgi:hypothetical protein